MKLKTGQEKLIVSQQTKVIGQSQYSKWRPYISNAQTNMKNSICILILLISCQLFAQRDTLKTEYIPSAVLTKYPLLTWLRKSPVEINCMLQSQLHYQDRRFKCGTNYVNKGDPCKKTKEYYEGIQIPDSLAVKIHPLFKSISLSFEHGDLQLLIIEFKDSMSIGRIKSMFALPAEQIDFPDNLIYIDYADGESAPFKTHDEKYTNSLMIVGFEHLGAGDVDCSQIGK